MTTLLDPGLLVLGGPVALAGGTRLLDKVVAQMRQASFVRPQVVLSTVHDNGVLHGAIEVALQAVRTTIVRRPADLDVVGRWSLLFGTAVQSSRVRDPARPVGGPGTPAPPR